MPALPPTSTNTTIPGFTLLGLPAELRNLLYDQVFHGDLSNSDSLALMRTSEQLHAEAGSHFYGNNTFVFRAPQPTMQGSTILPPINDRYLPYLKDIGIELDAGCAERPRVQEVAMAIKRLATIKAKFERISFLIQFPCELSSFLQDKYDDPILDKSHPITTALHHLLSSGVSKTVQIWMNGAWFAPGVASEMKDCYGSRLKFMHLHEERVLVELSDPLLYEKALAGRCSCTPCDIFGKTGDNSDDLNIAMGLDLDLVEPVLDLNTYDDDSILDLEEDDDDKLEKYFDEEDDVNMEDALVPLDPGEAYAISENWNYTSGLLADEAQMTKEIEFLVAMAPHLL